MALFEFEFDKIEDWRVKTECHPFEDGLGNICITVVSEYETPGSEKEKRLEEAKVSGVNKLLRFYGKAPATGPKISDVSIVPLADRPINSTFDAPIQAVLDNVELPTNGDKIENSSSLYDYAFVYDYFVPYRPCAKMRVFVKIPKDYITSAIDDIASCKIFKPDDGYLSAILSIENLERDIDYVVNSLEDFIPTLARSDKYISNLNIQKEFERLRKSKLTIQRYINLNEILPEETVNEECQINLGSILELGYDYDYNLSFALVGNDSLSGGTDKYTIGYDCLLESSILNHPTTANYLLNLQEMALALRDQLNDSFDIFNFLSTYTFPTPVILTKNEPTDGLNKFDSNGNLSSFANLANIISFDLDLNACKTPEQLQNENFIILDEETRASIADSARKTKKTYQAFSGDSDEMVKLRTTLGLPPSTDPPLISDVPEAWEFVEVPNALARELILGEPSRDSAFNLGLAEGLEEAFKYANEDILDLPEAVLKSKQDISFFRGAWGMRYVEEAGLPPGVVKIYLNDNPNKFRLAILDSRKSEYYAWKREQQTTTKEKAKEKLNILYADVMARLNIGCLLEETFECALEELIKLIGESAFNDPELSEFFDVSNAFDGLGLCPQDDPCDGTPALKVGLPIFQGIEIPSNFPTTDYLAGIINAAIAQLYNTLVNAIVSLITGIITGICKLVSALPDGVGELVSDGFNSWLSNTIGINVSELGDPQAWADAVTSSGGQGFLGAIGTLVSRSEQSFIAAATGTGISFNLPNPTTGIVEEVLVSPEFFYNVMSDVETATQELEVVLTPPELTSLYKGHASDDVLELAHRCLSRSPGGLFKSKESVEDTFSSLGRIVSPDLLEVPPQEDTPIENICDLGDGTNQAILRKNFLSDKDPELSDIEIEAILDKEKNELLEKLKRTLEFINRFKSGTLFPSFPSIFGGSQSLIPETPPVIQATLSSVSAALYSPVISNFNTAMTEYAPLYKTEIDVTENDKQAFFSLARELMVENGDFLSFNPKMVASNYLSFGGFFGTQATKNPTGPEDILTLGYTPSGDFNTKTTIIEFDEEYLGRYEWFKGNFDSGKHSSDWWKNNKGPDDEKFKRLIEKAGIRYVDLSEDDYTIFNTTNLIILIAIAATVAVAIIFPGTGMLITSLALKLVNTIGLGGTVLGSSLLVVGSVSALTATIAITTLAAATLITLGTVALSYALVKALIEKSVELVAWAVAKYHELKNPTEEEFKKAIECAYNDGELTEAAYNELKPASEELHEAITVAADTNQWAAIQAIADHLEDKDDENGTHTETFDISDFLVEPDPDYKTELILKSQVSGQWNLLKKDVFYTDAYIRKTPIIQEPTELQRESDFSEVITSFERKGVRAAGDFELQPLTDQISNFSLSQLSLEALLGVGIDLVERNRVQRKISNYGIENDSSIILGRKVALPGLLNYTFSSEIDVPDEEPSKSLLETWEDQDRSKHMQEYHIRLQEILQDTGFPESYTNDESILLIYENLFLMIAKNIADRTSFNRLYLEEYINALEFEYPKYDIMGFNGLQEDSVSLNESILQLDNTNEEYCDALSSTRRSATITGVRMLIRAFVAERAINCIQIFDTFHTEFMTSELFAKAVFSDIKLEMNKYQSSFVDTLQNDLFSDIKAVAAKYFEIQNLLGSDEPLPTTDKNAMIELIRQEIQDMYKTLFVQLRLDSLYHSMTWDDFVFDVLLTQGVYSSGEDPETGKVREKEFDSVIGAIKAKKNEPYEKNGEWIYGVELQYMGGMTIVLAECVGTGAPAKDADGCDTAKTTGNYQKAKDTLFASEVYQNIVSYIFPLKDIISLFTVYNLAATSDPAVFSATYGGKHVTDLFSETKLSILQIFLSSLYGGTEAVYVDPFLEKLKT